MGNANDPTDHEYGISNEQRARRESSKKSDNNPWPGIGGAIILLLIIFALLKGCS
ncbi:hypothetical protein [Winogradskyella sp.]|uniref:hypothetical protein n=1 Tax=Winogradskyella sp. TaxID=1883156 RepID=UPI002633CA7C|nr:hypothetical protein [Winogradskyella sp.]